MSRLPAPQRPPNSSDVARLAGVSRAMVSYVFNGRRDGATVPEATRARILGAAEQIGYRPNRTARALRTGRTNTIALWSASFATPYYASVLGHVQALTQADNYEIVVACGGITESLDSTYLHADGAIFIDKRIARVEREQSSLPVVSMGAYFDQTVDHVGIDLYTGTQMAIAHLQKQGKQRIAYITWNKIVWEAAVQRDSRLMAYHASLTQNGRELINIPVLEPGRRGAYNALRDFWNACPAVMRPDALLCLDDVLAIGVLAFLRDNGVSIPEEVAVIGCDGIEEGEFSFPSLTTLVQPVAEASRLAWQFLQHRFAVPDAPIQSAILTPLLTLRDSA